MPHFAVGALEQELVHDICMYNRTALYRMIELEKRNADRDRAQMMRSNFRGQPFSAR